MSAGAEVRAARVALGWTQARLAEALGVSRNHVAMCERGERRLDPGRWRLFLQAQAISLQPRSRKRS